MLQKFYVSLLYNQVLVKSFKCVAVNIGLNNIRKRNIASPAASIIKSAYDSCKGLKEPLENTVCVLNDYVPQIRYYTLSIEEAIVTLKLCLSHDYFDEEVIKKCITLLEDEYFKPILLTDPNMEKHPFVDLYDFVDQAYEFVKNLTVQDKVKLILWQWRIQDKGISYIKINEHNKTTTEEVDPEKKEIYETKKGSKAKIY
ncbi:hypothetical protein BdWA1_002089 [Babesia duncani]|uniref:Uncharacterized protein n=1 Tax=Babesia duncani TaxID=323732 RepID=A0AAD9UPI8_9APIC|nr:hypothetical protein BdWA1_002089 [Babesia duncani]